MLIPTMKQFSIEQLLDVLDSCHIELGNYYQDTLDKNTYFAARKAKEAHDYLYAENVVNNYPNQIH